MYESVLQSSVNIIKDRPSHWGFFFFFFGLPPVSDSDNVGNLSKEEPFGLASS